MPQSRSSAPTNPSNAAQLRLRRGARSSPAPSPSDEYPPPPPQPKLRRASTFSDTVSEARQSIKTSTDELLLPRANSRNDPSPLKKDEEESVWQSTPLALALLPAVGGLFFQNGSAVITDATLLVLAGIFLNWSVRLPWDWYQSARGIASSESSDEFSHLDGTPEAGPPQDDDDQHEAIPDQDTPDHGPSKPPGLATSRPTDTRNSLPRRELQRHELAALASCFLFPVIGAWVLHEIRSQLSRPSEGLVSNYNLTIFLLAAEIRPFSHLLKLVQARTLHLQRVVAAEPSSPTTASKVTDMAKRLDELETHIADSKTKNTSTPIGSADSKGKDNEREPPPDEFPSQAHLISQVRDSIQPDIDALKRAARRHEKRSASLSETTEKRLQDLEVRLQEILSLPGLQASRHPRSIGGGGASGPLFGLAHGVWTATVVFPVRSMWTVACWPARLAGRGVRGLTSSSRSE